MPERPRASLGPNKREEIHAAMRELREMWEADQKKERDQEVWIPSFLKDDRPGKIHQNNLKPDESNASKTSSCIQHMIDTEKKRATPQEEGIDSLSNLDETSASIMELLLADESMQIPPIYNATNAMGNIKERELIRHINKEINKLLKAFLKEHKLTPDIAEQKELKNKLVRLAHITAYMRATYSEDDYYEDLNMVIDTTERMLQEHFKDAMPGLDIYKLARVVVLTGGTSITHVETKDYSYDLDITNNEEAPLIAEKDINITLDTIDKLKHGALLWYYQKITGDKNPKIPESQTLEKLLVENNGKIIKKIPNMRRAAISAAIPVGGALAGGAISGALAAPFYTHLLATLAGGTAGVATAAWWNNKGESGSRLYDVQLLTALQEFNNKLQEDRGYVSGPKVGIIRENLKKLLRQPSTLGREFNKLTLSELSFILDKKTLSARQKQKYAQLAVASLGAVAATWPHLDNLLQASSTSSAPAIPTDTPEPTRAVADMRGVLSQFFSFSGSSANNPFLRCLGW